MTTNDTYLAVFLGSKTSSRMKAWVALPEADRRAKEQEGMAAWKAWVEKHRSAVSAMGGPLGKTKKVTERGIGDVSNEMGAFMVVPGGMAVNRNGPSPPELVIRERTASEPQAFYPR